ncbi:helix-turn-helix transcriptional regulator [Enterococcus faecium]|uniref:helix-turn-helix domain-containing protein n=1 Tax=Streptococcus TaxID=1301 RepID=UPI00044862F9|nr:MULTISPECIES: helix-turn-helix transcriptional regulator [Streptococcus]MBJ0557441.1 helix-turn-helix transcriptional regulator [Enterococcus faecium]MDU2024122.1 helix-turn-helix transcriptional regulator [Finegoldia magna]NSQ70748.1 helix-turn-helix transcriptional regulator [Enterococcus faecalis]HEN8871719.1 helix-turn-helix transcriptional regulator [Streptococcus agalactiae]HER9816785.1 helix-turn-helix transcriptional regulator [Streptococcus pyogenes]
MKCKITLQERLKDLRVAHNLNLEELAKLTGISKSALGNYENNDYKEINHGNLVTLAQFYNVSTDYLLCLTENKNHPNTDLTNLHLSDDMIDLLLSGSINNRLLCEIATHDKFKELMADTEIFIDGIATKCFNDINDYLEDVRTEIINRHPNIDEDIPLRTLSASQIREEDFFCHITHKTWDTILKDIRKNHEQDIDSISEDDDTLSLQKIRQIMISSGNNIDKFIKIFCNSFQLKYKKLSEDEKEFLRKLFKKSPIIKNSGLNFRKKKK